MHLIFHQFKTDWLHFRAGLLALWFTFAAQLIVACSFINVHGFIGAQMILLLIQVVATIFFLVPLVQADALVGSSAQWLTRPMRRPHLFWAKTAFILLGVVVPRLAPQMVICALRHYSAMLCLESVTQVLVFTLAVVFFVAALAALTPDLPRFFLALGIILAVFFVEASLLAVLYRHAETNSASLNASAVIGSTLFFAVCALFVWIWQVCAGHTVFGKRLLGFALVVLPWMLYGWSHDFLSPRTRPLPPLGITYLDKTNSLGGGPGVQLLLEKFLVTGLPEHGLVVTEDVAAKFDPVGQWKSYSLPPFRPDPATYQVNHQVVIKHVRPMDSPQQKDYLAAIRQFLPPATLWGGLSHGSWGGFPIMKEIFQSVTNRPLIGSLYAKLELDQFQVMLAARLPVRIGTWNLVPGTQLVIHEVTPGPNGVQVVLEEIRATPLLDRSGNLFGSGFGTGMPHTLCTYVLYHPDWGTAGILNQNFFAGSNPDFLSGETRIVIQLLLPYSVLEERLTGVSGPESLQQAVLCVFVPVYQGTMQDSIEETNFNLSSVAHLNN